MMSNCLMGKVSAGEDEVLRIVLTAAQCECT